MVSLVSEPKLFRLPAALSAAALGSGRSEDEGSRFLPTSLAVPFTCKDSVIDQIPAP